MNIIKKITLLLFAVVLLQNCTSTESSDREIFSLHMKEVESIKGDIDVVKRVITVNLNYSDNVDYKKLTPVFKISEGAVMRGINTSGQSGGIGSDVEKETDFTSDRWYEIVAPDGTAEQYRVVVNILSEVNFENVTLDATAGLWTNSDGNGKIVSENVILKGEYTSATDWKKWNVSSKFSEATDVQENAAFAKTDTKKFAMLKLEDKADTLNFDAELSIDSLSYCLSNKTVNELKANASAKLNLEIKGISTSNTTVFTVNRDVTSVRDWKSIDMTKLGSVQYLIIGLTSDADITKEICFDNIKGKIHKK